MKPLWACLTGVCVNWNVRANVQLASWFGSQPSDEAAAADQQSTAHSKAGVYMCGDVGALGHLALGESLHSYREDDRMYRLRKDILDGSLL